MQFICPVCKKAGLDNYTSTHIICPNCESDLKPYLLLHSLPKSKSNKISLFVIGGMVLLVLALSFIFYNSIEDKNQRLNINIKAVLQYQDTIKLLNSAITQIKNIKPGNNTIDQEVIIQYKVKNGDYPSKIAEFFYNDWKMYSKIETDNNLLQPYILKVGQVLIIKLKKE
jgi:nucleoid-associated protein YgaU